MKRKLSKYSVVLLSVLAIAFLSSFGHEIYHSIEMNEEHALLIGFFVIAVVFILSFFVFYLSHLAKLPSFVFAIFLGLAAKPLLAPIRENGEILGAIVGLGATLILFGGGLEIPFSNFKKLIWKILSVSFIGLFVTAFLYSWAVWILAAILGFKISIMVSVLLGALLASTDPAAIIPVLKRLRFFNRSVKDIIISESAVTDVVGTLLTVVFISIALSGSKLSDINQWYVSVFSYESGLILAKQLLFGVAMGYAGYLALELLLKCKHFFKQEFEADSAFFIAVPIVIFTGALFLGGSGYLAAFVAGLIFHLTEHLTDTERFFNNLVDGFMKPTIFILLGALVDLPSLIHYAPIGIAIALVFMLVIRPIAVFLSLGIFRFQGKDRLSMQDILFISFIRETGAIPAVLLLTVVSLGLSGMDGLVEIGMWTILLTLIIEPLLTPWVARKLKVAEIMEDKRKPAVNSNPAIMLVTRGESFIERLPFVTKWATLHEVRNITVMLCLEDNYTKDLEREIRGKAEKAFSEMKGKNRKNGLTEIEFQFISRKGSLHENIDNIAKTNHKISTIFVGNKMLDYRLQEIKQLQIPFYFMD